MILDKVLEHAIATPNAVAIVDDKRTLTYRELVYGSSLFAGLLDELAPRGLWRQGGASDPAHRGVCGRFRRHPLGGPHRDASQLSAEA